MPAAPAEPVAEVLGAVRALRSDAGAGLVVTIGLGAAGPAVLAAAREEVAARYLGPDGPRLAAAIALDGDGPATFALGERPEGQGWAARAPLLCAALASASSRCGSGPAWRRSGSTGRWRDRNTRRGGEGGWGRQRSRRSSRPAHRTA